MEQGMLFKSQSSKRGRQRLCVRACACVLISFLLYLCSFFFPIMSHKSSLSQDNMFAIFTGINIHVGGGRAALVAFVCLFCQ